MVQRLSGRPVFEALKKSPQRVRNRSLGVAYLPSSAPEGTRRVGYAVSKKIGGAVKRNRLRRRLRAIVSEVASELETGCYLVSASPRSARISHEELKNEVRQAMLEASREPGR